MRLFLALLLVSVFADAQPVLDIIKQKNKNYFKIVEEAERELNRSGRGRGTANKQFERWKYEQQFHLQADGSILPVSYDQDAYLSAPAYPTEGSAQWTEFGPYQWQATKGWNPGVGRVTSVAIHPLDSNLIFVASPGGGVWRSTTNGNAWKPLTDRNAAWMQMYSVAVDPQNKAIVYAGSNAGQLIKSIDTGNTWVSVGRYLSGTVAKILIHPSNSNILFVGAQNGILRSTDGGVSWTKTYANTIEDIEFKPGDPNIMYATGSFTPSVIRSTDNGVTWTGLGTNEGITFNARSLVAVSANDPTKVYVAQAYGNEFGRLYMSTNSGQTFSIAVNGSAGSCTNYFGYGTTGCETGGQAGYDMALAVNPSNANEIYLGGINVWRSTNGGTSFTCLTQWSYPTSGFGYVHADIHALEFFGTTLYTGSDGGIYKRSGTGWQDLSTGLGIRQFYRVAVTKNKFTGGSQDNGSSVFTGSKWYEWLGGDGMDCFWIDTNKVYGTSQYGTLYTSSDQGTTYSSVATPARGNWVSPLVYEGGNIYMGLDAVYYKTPAASGWTKAGPATTSAINALAVRNDYIYASVSVNLYVSRDRGATWKTIAFPSTINAITVDPNNAERIWVACNSTSNRVFYSENGGDVYVDKSVGLPATIVRSLAYKSDTVYAGMNIGVFRLTDSTWTDLTRNLPFVAVNDLQIDNGYLYAGTYGRGLWRIPVSDTSTGVAIVVDTTGGGSGVDTTKVDTVTYYLTTPTIAVSRNSKNVHTIQWDASTNDVVLRAEIYQSTDGVNFRPIYTTNTATGVYRVSTTKGYTYQYYVRIDTKKFTKMSTTATITNPLRGR